MEGVTLITYEVFVRESEEADEVGSFLATPTPDVLFAVTNLFIGQGWYRVRLTGNAGQIFSDGSENEETGEVDWRIDPRRNDEVREN